jgi:hypothetical protein
MLWNICVTNDHGYVPLVINTSRSFPHSRLITGFVTRLTRRVPLVEQELLTLPEHLSSPPVLIFEVMTSTLPKGNLGSVASLLAATFYQGNLDRNHKLWNIISSERYILHSMFCRSLFVLLYLFFFWSLCCQFFFDIRILIAPLVSSNSSQV